MKRSVLNYCTCYLIFSHFVLDGVDACYREMALDPNAEMTPDFDLVVGSDLVINCSIRITSLPSSNKSISSSDLVIRRTNETFSNFTRVVDNRTIQMKIPNATLNHTGDYTCKLSLPEKLERDTICVTGVRVGYPPNPIKKFSCINKNFESLYCSWNAEKDKNPNDPTKYTITTYLFNNPSFEIICPKRTTQPNSCEWSKDSDPKFMPFTRNAFFIIRGRNHFGQTADSFTVDLYSIVVPNTPPNLEITDILQQSALVSWKSPINYPWNFTLKYQINISSEESDYPMIHNIERSTSFKLQNLIPHLNYTVSIRCRSIYTENNGMWSDVTSLMFKTLSDVPYKVPDIIPESYELHLESDELHLNKNSRSATLYWKAVPKIHYNGEAFHYHIKYYKNDRSRISEISHLNNSLPFVKIENLQKDASYTFKLHSANEIGISKDYGLIFIDTQDKIPPAPRDVKVIFQGIGSYNLTWNAPSGTDIFRYVVFW